MNKGAEMLTPETMRLGELASNLGETERQIQRVVDEGFAPRPEKKGQYQVLPVIRGLLRYYRDKSARVSESRTIDAARKSKAEADLVEIALAEKKGTLMLTANHVRWIKELAVQTRVTIANAEYLPMESRKKLCNQIAAIKVAR